MYGRYAAEPKLESSAGFFVLEETFFYSMSLKTLRNDFKCLRPSREHPFHSLLTISKLSIYLLGKYRYTRDEVST